MIEKLKAFVQKHLLWIIVLGGLAVIWIVNVIFFMDAAVTLARAYAVRERGEEDAADDVDWEAVDKAIHGVERQIEYIDDLNTWTGNITRDAEKLADRLGKMKKDLNRELERLTEQIENLRP